MAEFLQFPTAHWAEQQPNAVAIIWKKGKEQGENSALSSSFTLFPNIAEKITWTEWQRLVLSAQLYLGKIGVNSNSLIAYQGTHRLAGLLCYCATLAMGARLLQISPMMPEKQVRSCLLQNGVKFLITDEHFADFSQDLTAYMLQANCNQIACFNLPATFTLTSGSSGSPKAVVHTIQQHLDNAKGVCELMDFKQQHCWLLSLPLFHVSGQGIVWRWLSVGATLMALEDRQDFWQGLAQSSHASLVPTQLQRYLVQTEKRIKKQKILLGGAFIPSELITQAMAQGIETYAGYGLTEMASTVCAVKMENDNVGKPLLQREVQIEKNEIWVRGAGLGLGYWLHQQIVPFINDQGWFATKDKGFWNKQNHLVVEGRLDNMFISGGENIQPEQIEKILLSSGLIEQVMVVPISDNEFGFRPVAVVRFAESFNLQAVRLLENFAKRHLEKFKLPVAYVPFPSDIQGGIKYPRKQLQQEIALQFKREKNV
ncbi:o-succinylbenzoate--CoA ligase [Ursidibacter maritimus]|uniref:O-succinylbenzoate--CoA ligase n=1 Tax=Ursidibacter maritimus TaxID=1331689 RepID=A0A949T364_9PAST|nr:o-succinylbenzoate--CoA ligase [Ursidibacter maritimus]KAE9538242.1 o-succinylbenzoate--CoA ligase [Ursidibacter maritimus]MBV6523878.1 o-succinylbenzoate--CoA ligase [Ursidibacter maritimus]MBV6526270.1 o-succinylbenzoate--CoA ligase [Ursidibacter maritimus]MBV6527704.1 o-succinylbenzoate--CoA ligase [Ursidibacter maritimus]MBV6529535.1 o-succinylbenzoate--CoA ligase [Ursidibacter maritimus]